MPMPKIDRQTLANQCVKCAICLPHCPTYQVSQDENESPRGRIALMQGLAQGALPPSLKLAKHLDNCLQCGSCTDVCPADVQYDTLLDLTHQEVPQSISPKIRRFGRLAHTILKSPKRVMAISWLLWLAERCGLRKLYKKTPPIERPRTLNLASDIIPAGQKQVVLLSGCLGKALDRQTLEDTIFVLKQLGFHVSVPKKQSCCGSVAYHHGLFQEADDLLREQAHLGADPDTAAIISLASGCSAHLYDMKKTNKHPWLNRVQDIHDFLATIDFKQHNLQAVSGEYKLHIPCTAKNQLQQENTLLNIYRAIPELTLDVIQAPSRCCGAAGLYMLEHPKMAEALGHQVLKAAEEGDIASSNIGCRLHLQCLQPERHVLHPISLLARSLGLPK